METREELVAMIVSQHAKIAELKAALEPIAKIALWRDTYPDGPDIVTDYKLTFVTPDQVRTARQHCDITELQRG